MVIGMDQDFIERQGRLASYIASLSEVIGHADRVGPLENYCHGLLLPLNRKSVESLAAAVAPDRVSARRQSLPHFVAHSPWSDARVLAKVRELVLPSMERGGLIEAWIVDDTGLPRKGKHSVGVARQYCGQLGKRDDCQMAVSLSLASETASLPIAYQLYLPKTWAQGGGARPAFPRRWSSRPSRRSRLSKSRQLMRLALRPAWCWPTPAMATTPVSEMP